MRALLRYPKKQRSAVAREWARRSNAVQDAARALRGVDSDTIRRRALHDARGAVLREGICFKKGREIVWCVRRSVAGRVDQFDLVSNGRVILTAGIRRLPCEFRPHPLSFFATTPSQTRRSNH